MSLFLKIIVSVYSCLIAFLIIGIGVSFQDYYGNLKFGLFILVGVLFVISAISPFLLKKFPKIILLPIWIFVIFALFELINISMGVISDTENRISIRFWLVQYLIRSIFPFLIGFFCFKARKKMKGGTTLN